ncbi:PREDICTED: uncharacterized protein C3orf84 homolog [Myotis davidii]|uniref:uncharacterized protein C3orf84 homolog n=1 Tax=Myotis davidii TaxID=225400 RepID=UPI0007674C96|nr:PREDICTED: uncharacterized protein C3orf84 homolog [Myotis davidii]
MYFTKQASLHPPPLLQHNNGFYGHYRGQFKNESALEYRLAAKPQPPTIFLQRCKEPVRQHFFSKHDNRTSFDKGPYCLLQGIGRRKNMERLCQRHTFLHWASSELELYPQRPLESSYQSTFRLSPGPSDAPQRLVHFVQVHHPRTCTTYQQNFCQPSQSGHCGGDCGGPPASGHSTPTNLPKIPGSKPLQHYLHEGVSECLNWSRALNKVGCCPGQLAQWIERQPAQEGAELERSKTLPGLMPGSYGTANPAVNPSLSVKLQKGQRSQDEEARASSLASRELRLSGSGGGYTVLPSRRLPCSWDGGRLSATPHETSGGEQGVAEMLRPRPGERPARAVCGHFLLVLRGPHHLGQRDSGRPGSPRRI